MQPEFKRCSHTGMNGRLEPKYGSALVSVLVTSIESDQDLIRKVLEGNQRAYEFLIARYQDAVAKFIWRLIPQPEDREEICQDVFVKVFLNLSKFRFDSKFSTWLYRIAWRTALTSLRRKQLPLDELGMDIESDDRSLEAVSDDGRLHRLVDAEIRKLKIDERSIITLFHLQDVTIEEISKIVGKPEGTVKSILHRVRQKLRVRLEALKPEPTVSEGVA